MALSRCLTSTDILCADKEHQHLFSQACSCCQGLNRCAGGRVQVPARLDDGTLPPYQPACLATGEPIVLHPSTRAHSACTEGREAARPELQAAL